MKRLKKYKFQLCSFFIPFFILTIIFLFRCYGRDTTVFISDSYDQYMAFLSYFKDVLSFKQLLFYSLNSGLGSDMFSTYAYYLASPLNFILIFFPKEHIDLFFMIIIILKISLSSLFMFIYMNKKNIPNMWKLIFSFCYAFMAYTINYYFHIMWLDCIMLAPLLIYGIEKLIKKDQGKLYGIILFLAIFSNYYIGFSLCLFSVLYFLYFLILEYHHQGKKYLLHKLSKFFIISVLAGLSCMVLILPSLLQLMNVDRPLASYSSTSLLQFLSKGYIASHNYRNILNRSYVNWYCGIIIILLVIRYFLNHKILKKEKVASFIMISIFLLSFFIPKINIIWHGFSNPVGFNYRYSFLFSLFLILLGSKEIETQESLSKKNFLWVLLGYTILSFIIIIIRYDWNLFYCIQISVLLMALYEVLIEYPKKLNNNKEIKLINILTVILVCGELIFNIFFTFRNYEFIYLTSKDDLKDRNQAVRKNKDLYHRMEFVEKNTSNDALMLDYYGMDTFNSLLDKKTTKILSKFGFTSLSNALYYKDSGTLISDSLLGISKKYGLQEKREKYQTIGTYSCSTLNGLFYSLGKTKCHIDQNELALSLGYMVNLDSLNNTKINKFDNVFAFQNNVLNSMVGKNKKYFKFYKITPIRADTYQYQLDDQDQLYFYIDAGFKVLKNEKLSTIKIYINDQLYTTLSGLDHGIKIIPNRFKNQTVTLRFEISGDIEIHSAPVLASLDTKAVEQSLYELAQNEMEIEKLTNTKIEANIQATKQKNILFLSIPNSKGWTIYVDGKKQTKLELYDTFLGVKVTPGKHHIILKYHTPGFYSGVVISSISLLLLIWYLKKEAKDRKK